MSALAIDSAASEQRDVALKRVQQALAISDALALATEAKGAFFDDTLETLAHLQCELLKEAKQALE